MSLFGWFRKSLLWTPTVYDTRPYDCPMNATNIQEKLDLFTDQWSPKKIGELNGQQILLAKIQGEFVFHKHDDEDELFMVLEGQLVLELRDRTIVVNPGEFYTVPKGVEHRPVAEAECSVMLVEPTGLVNTGDGEKTDRTTKQKKSFPITFHLPWWCQLAEIGCVVIKPEPRLE